jgi:hypothetical protein
MTNPIKYVSRYSNDKEVSAAQYITEIICEQKAKIDKVDLYYRFWTSKKWSMFYRNQIGTAHKLLKKHSAKAIINALQSPAGRNIFSLRAPHLPAIIEQQEEVIAQENQLFTKNIERKTEIVFGHKKPPAKNILSRLEDIDNDS